MLLARGGVAKQPAKKRPRSSGSTEEGRSGTLLRESSHSTYGPGRPLSGPSAMRSQLRRTTPTS